MGLKTFTLEEKISIVEIEVHEARKGRRDPGSPAQRHYEILKSVIEDLRAREQLPRNNTLGVIERSLERMKETKTSFGYDKNRMLDVAALVIGRWPVIRQALEQFGEESAE